MRKRHILILMMVHAMIFGAEEQVGKTQINGDQPIALDAHAVVGTLANGLHYYVRANATPQNRAELRLVVNAGSVLEDDDQQGFAHFVEHMAFNGTQHFKKNELIDFLESIGMRFGHDLNAATGQDATFYMLQIPTEDQNVLDRGFQVLADWAQGLSFAPEEIEKERGVILEEWRMGKGADERMMKQQYPILFHGSRYADRLPIGKPEIIRSGSHEALKRFYRTWYRPDLMAVVAVGDFDCDAVLEIIKKKFGSMVQPDHPRPRASFDVPVHDETLFAIASDPEATRATVSVVFKGQPQVVRTLDDYRRSLVEDLFLGMLNQRLHERTQEAEPPFLFGIAARAGFVREMGGFMAAAALPEKGVIEGFRQLWTELLRVQRFGFTGAELERQKKELLRAVEQAYEERETTRSSRYASEYMAHFLMESPAPDAATKLELTQSLLPGVDLEDVHALVSAWMTDRGRVVLLDMPRKEELEIPSEVELRRVMKDVDQAALTPYQEQAIGQDLISQMPDPGKIESVTRIEELGVTEWTLNNGVRVVLKPTDFKSDEIRMEAFAPGGYSLAAQDEIFSAKYADTIVHACGLGAFSNVVLERMLAGKMLRLTPFVEECYQGLEGWTSPKDLETFFQLTYLHFTGLRQDPAAFGSLKKRLRAKVANRGASPEIVFKDKLKSILYQDHPFRQPLTEEAVDRLDLKDAVTFMSDRFGDPGAFTFIFVGNFDVTAMKPLVTRYLGGLAKTHPAQSWKDLGIRPPKGIVRERVFKGTEPKSQVALVFSGGFPWSDAQRYRLSSLMDVLRIELRERLREEMGGVYSIAAWGSAEKQPAPRYTVGIYFGCDPNRADEMVTAVFQVIDEVKAHGVSDDELKKIKEIQTRKRETDLKENPFWVKALSESLRLGEDVRRIQDYGDLVTALTSSDIQKAAKEFLRETDYVQLILYPEQNPG